MRRARVFEAVPFVAVVALVACTQTPAARLPVRSDCLASDVCEGRGWVIVEVDVTPSGSAENAEIVEACPDDGFNGMALWQVEQWRWRPSAEGRRDLQLKICRP